MANIRVDILQHKLEWSAPRSTCVVCRHLVTVKRNEEKKYEKSVTKSCDVWTDRRRTKKVIPKCLPCQRQATQ